MDRTITAKNMIGIAERMADEDLVADQLVAAKEALAEKLRPILGMRPVFKVSKSHHGYLYFEDEIGTSSIGVFASVFSDVSIRASISLKPVQDGTFWTKIDLNWKYHNGGTNGADVATAWFDPTKGSWNVRTGR